MLEMTPSSVRLNRVSALLVLKQDLQYTLRAVNSRQVTLTDGRVLGLHSALGGVPLSFSLTHTSTTPHVFNDETSSTLIELETGRGETCYQ